MKAIINGSTLSLDEMQLLNSGSIDYYELAVEMTSDWDDTTKKAVIIKDGETKGTEIPVVEGTLKIDRSIEGKYYIGFVGYRTEMLHTTDTDIIEGKTYYILENETYVVVANPVKADLPTYYESKIVYQISTNLVVLTFDRGAGNVPTVEIIEELPQPNVFETYIAQVDEIMRGASNIDIDVSKTGGVTTVSITNKAGETKEAEVLDGFNPTVTVNTSTDTEYTLDITDINGTVTTPNLKGQNGADGDSPTVAVNTSTSSEYVLDITDKNGTITTPNLKGQDGDDGVSPAVTVNTSTSDTYTLDITDATGTTTTPNLKGTKGDPGDDGFSPTITENTSTSTTYILDITDVNGTTTTPNLKGQDGQDGQDGFSPIIAVNTSTSTEYTLNITDATGTKTTPNLKGQDGTTTIGFEVVSVLPQTGEPGIVYLVPNSGSIPNIYDEYLYVNNTWELIGNTQVDLTNYVQKTDITSNISSSSTTSQVASGKGVYDYVDNKITYGTTDLTAGTSPLTTGTLYLVYE